MILHQFGIEIGERAHGHLVISIYKQHEQEKEVLEQGF